MAKTSGKNVSAFFLGLLEGDGSIQVNHWKKRGLRYRWVIKLAYSDANYTMCAALRDHLGVMKLHVRNHVIVMVEDHRHHMPRLMAMVERYGLLLTARRKQYAFFRYCFRNNVTYTEYAHIKTLGSDWAGFRGIEPYARRFMLNQPHWPDWLCGFTEAAGCFCKRANGNHSFSIAQKGGAEVMHAVKTYFKATNQIRQTSRVHVLEVYASSVLVPLVAFYQSPGVIGLLGQKKVQMLNFDRSLKLKVARRGRGCAAQCSTTPSLVCNAGKP
jgi:hypothetical protein